MLSTVRLATLAAALWLAAGSALAAAVAFVSDLSGEARLAGGSRVTFLKDFEAGARVVLEKGARLVLVYTASGTEYALAGPGEFVVEATEAKAVKGAPPTHRTVVARPDPVVIARLSETATASIRMRSAPPPAAPARPGPLYPRSAQIATLQPTLAWSGAAPPDGFAVSVVAADGKVAWKGTSRAQSVKLPVKLAPASRYTWTLAMGDTTIGEALFETLSADAIKRAEASSAAAKTFSDRILHAFVLQDIGATQDARQAWAALARERPDLPELAVLAR